MFDTNAHPTVDGRWLDGRPLCGFDEAEEKLRSAGFTRACAVALPNVGSYGAEAFARAARSSPEFWVPIAALERPTRDFEQAAAAMRELSSMGFKGIKVHPRLMGRMMSVEELSVSIAAASEAGLPTLICSYPFGSPGSGVRGNLLEIVSAALEPTPSASVMLMHAGCVDLLRFIEFARMIPSVLLDLSFTLMKYSGSSLDADLQFAFRTFDQRICIGSDFPEFDATEVRRRFDHLVTTTGISEAKAANIATRNAARFFRLA